MKAKHAKQTTTYLFLILLFLSSIAVIVYSLIYLNEDDGEDFDMTSSTTTVITTTTTVPTTTTTTVATTTTESKVTDGVTTLSGTTTTGIVTDSSTTITTVDSVTTTTVGTTATAGPTTTISPVNGKVSFPKTLFIGDSRTEGLRMYGRITDADFFSATSLSSFSVMKKAIKVNGGGSDVTLEQHLKTKQYTTVYIMLGINEIGSSASSVAGKYSEIIALVKAHQPNAKIVVQSTLHVRSDKERGSINNSNVNKLNAQLQTLADNTTVFYLDVNPVFDDANGAMGKEYSNDGVHFKSKYYPLWTSHLANNRF